MAQIKIYGIDAYLNPIKEQLSDVIHNCVVEALKFPKDKKFHRFFPMKDEDMFYPDNRSKAYMIIEIMIMEGRKVQTKKKLIQLLFEKLEKNLNIDKFDVEICIIETPACNWGFRGICGDEIQLDYEVEV